MMKMIIVATAVLMVAAEEIARITVTAAKLTVTAAWYYCKPVWAS